MDGQLSCFQGSVESQLRAAWERGEGSRKDDPWASKEVIQGPEAGAWGWAVAGEGQLWA